MLFRSAALGDYGVQLFSVSAQNTPVPPDQYDPYENDTNELLIGISSIRSKAEIARMRRKYRTGMRNRILVYHLPVQIPFGYRRPEHEQYNRKAVPEPVPSLAPILIEIKDRFLRGQSTGQLIDYLNEQNIPPPRGKVWHRQTVRDILRNPFYAGFVQFEKSKVKKDRRFKRKSRDRHIPAEKIVTSTGLHQPLWDEAVLREIDAELKRRSRSFKGRKNNQFTGLLHCGECDAPMWRQKNGSRLYPDRLIWRCSIHRSQHLGIHHQELVERVGALLASSLQPYLQKRQSSAPPEKKTHIKDSAWLDDLKAQRTRLEDGYLRGLFSIDVFQRRLAALDQKIRSAEDENSEAQTAALQRQSVIRYLRSTLGDQAAHIPALIARGDPIQLNRILHLLLQKIVIHSPDSIELIYRA